MRRGPCPPPAPTVEIRELSTEDDGNGFTYLKIEPLNTMAVATTGQALIHRGLESRKALRAALAENSCVKGEGSPARSRRELLGHAQLTLDFN